MSDLEQSDPGEQLTEEERVACRIAVTQFIRSAAVAIFAADLSRVLGDDALEFDLSRESRWAVSAAVALSDALADEGCGTAVATLGKRERRQ